MHEFLYDWKVILRPLAEPLLPLAKAYRSPLSRLPYRGVNDYFKNADLAWIICRPGFP